MRVPTSTLVFAIATCVLFGLGLRETLNGPPDDATGDGLSELFDRAAGIPDVEVESADPEVEPFVAVPSDEELAANLEALWGPRPATLGRAFGAFTLGAPFGDSDRISLARRQIGAATGTTIDFELDRTSISAVSIALYDGCPTLADWLSDLWGAYRLAGERMFWIDDSDSVRAVLVRTGIKCRMRHERFVSVATWLDRAPTAVVPMAMIGAPSGALVEWVAARPSANGIHVDASVVGWSDIGVGRGIGRTWLAASVVGDKVVAISARVEVDVETTEEIQAQLTALLGESRDDDSGKYPTVRWSGKQPASLELTAGAEVVVTLGKPPR